MIDPIVYNADIAARRKEPARRRKTRARPIFMLTPEDLRGFR